MKAEDPIFGMLFSFLGGMSVMTLAVNFFCAQGLLQDPIRAASLFGAAGPKSLGLLLAVRAVQGALFACLGKQRGGKIRILLAFLFLGAAYGGILSWLTWGLGFWALAGFFCLVLPHFACYGAAWLLLLVRNQYGANVRQGRLWALALALTLLGTASELLISPLLRALFDEIFI